MHHFVKMEILKEKQVLIEWISYYPRRKSLCGRRGKTLMSQILECILHEAKFTCEINIC